MQMTHEQVTQESMQVNIQRMQQDM